MFQLTSVKVLLEIVVIFFTSITELAPNGYLWIVPLLHSVCDM